MSCSGESVEVEDPKERFADIDTKTYYDVMKHNFAHSVSRWVDSHGDTFKKYMETDSGRTEFVNTVINPQLLKTGLDPADFIKKKQFQRVHDYYTFEVPKMSGKRNTMAMYLTGVLFGIRQTDWMKSVKSKAWESEEIQDRLGPDSIYQDILKKLRNFYYKLINSHLIILIYSV